MKVFLNVDQPKMGLSRIFVQPGNEIKDRSEWFDIAKSPIMYHVVFKNGVAEVDSALGQYMLDKGLAKSSPLVFPRGFQNACA